MTDRETGPSSSSSEETENKPIWNCLNCRKRKIRCDRRDPCSHCVKSDLSCAFPVTGRAPTRRSKSSPDAGGKARQRELLEKLNHLEAVVQRMQDCDARQRRLADGAVDDDEIGTLVSIRTGNLYVENGFWATLCDESRKLLKDMENEDLVSINNNPFFMTATPKPSYFGMGDASIQAQEWCPLPSQIPYLWQVYLTNVDPIIKVLHTPTMNKVIQESSAKFRTLDPTQKALLCSIVIAAIESLSKDQVTENFNQDKAWLISSLSYTVEKTLAQAGFLNTLDTRVLQAIVIYLDCLGQQHGDRTVWAMTGLLTRTAVSMGLHRDGSHFPNMSIFEAEMRRRLWWYICFVDLRFGDAQAAHMAISEGMFDTKEPANVNDTGLFPEMEQPPQEQYSFTDSSVLIYRCEIWHLMPRAHGYVSMRRLPGQKKSMQEELVLMQQSLKRLENKVLRHLDLNQPLHRLIETMTRINFARAELLLTHKEHFSSETTVSSLTIEALEHDNSFMNALSSVERVLQTQDDDAMQSWGWITRGCIPWDSLAVLVVRLLGAVAAGWTSLCERAWQTAVTVVERMPETMKAEPVRQPMWVVMEAVRRRRHEIVSSNETPELRETDSETLMFEKGYDGCGIGGEWWEGESSDNAEAQPAQLQHQPPFLSEEDLWMGMEGPSPLIGAYSTV